MCPEKYREHLCCQAWTEQARPQHGSNPTVRGTEAGRGRTLWASECGCVSFSFVCSHLFLQDQDQEPGEGGRTVQRYSLSFRSLFGWGNLWRVPQKPIRACCGTTGLHACIMVGSARIQFNGSLGPPIASSPSLPCGCYSVDMSAFPSAYHRVCLLTCSAAVQRLAQQTRSQSIVDVVNFTRALCREAEVWVLSGSLDSLHWGPGAHWREHLGSDLISQDQDRVMMPGRILLHNPPTVDHVGPSERP